MNCPKCDGLIMSELTFGDNQFVEDIFCLNCGERYYPEGVNQGAKLRDSAKLELFNNFNKLVNYKNVL